MAINPLFKYSNIENTQSLDQLIPNNLTFLLTEMFEEDIS